MKHSAMYPAQANLLRAFPWRGLSIVAVISIGWLLRKRSRWDGTEESYAIRAYKGHYVDPTNLYKFYGSYGKS